jgi:hypothetical protein
MGSESGSGCEKNSFGSTTLIKALPGSDFKSIQKVGHKSYPDLNCVEEIKPSRTDGWRRGKQHSGEKLYGIYLIFKKAFRPLFEYEIFVIKPEHATELLHVMELEHLELLVKRVLTHDHIHKLLLAIGTHCQHVLRDKFHVFNTGYFSRIFEQLKYIFQHLLVLRCMSKIDFMYGTGIIDPVLGST